MTRNSSIFTVHHLSVIHLPFDPHKIPLVWGLFLFLILLPSLLSAEELGQRIQRVTLKNGLRLLMLERHHSPTVSLYIRYRAGAVDEVDGKTGTAHLLEHMMFKGTKTIGSRNYRQEEKIIRQIEKIGTVLDREKAKGKTADQTILAHLNNQLSALQTKQRRLVISNEIDRLYTENGAVGLNASTGHDLITYQVSIPANRIELWARIESDRMVNPVFREFYTERDVIMEERRQRAESDPDGKLLEAYLATAFTSHPYRRPVLGWPSDMKYLDMANMRNFYKKTHVPNNMVVAIVGDIRQLEVRRIVEKYFGPVPPQELSCALITEEPLQSGERRVDLIYAAEPHMIMGYHKPPAPDHVDYTFDVIESILTKGRTSRLFKSLVDEKHIAENIEAANGLPGGRYPNQFVIFATPRHPHDCSELEQAIGEEIEKLKTDPVPLSELEKVKNQIRADFIRGLNSNTGLASMISYYEALLGDYRYLTDYTDKIDRITPEDVLHAAKTYLTKGNRTIATLVKSQ
jgi:predicted Zn-dependent peptidase